MPDPSPPALEMVDVSKSFGGVQALRGVDFMLRAGEIHGLVGENGAGKSTLMKIIAGVHAPGSGRMTIEGRDVSFRTPREAIAAGIGMVHQELSTVPDLTVAENVFLGKQPTGTGGLVAWRRMRSEARRQLADLGLDVDPRQRIGALPIGLQQLIEIARVVFSGARIIILDEPTSALSPPEVELLFTVLRRLREAGRSIIFISHFLDDILRISDSVTVFRNGRHVATSAVAAIDKAWVIEQMIGRGHADLEESYTSEIPLAAKPGAPVAMQAQGLTMGRTFRDVTLDIRKGEILGIYGFMGCGQIELARALFGKIVPDSGTLTVAGRPRRLRNTTAAHQAGIAFVPESRRAMLFGQEPVYKNASIAILGRIAKLWLRPGRERELASAQVAALGIRPSNVEARLGALSGGNQQKVALAKWLSFPPDVLILSEPTRGMDVGAKDDVVRIVRRLRDEGLAVVVMSTEPETVLSLADRILIMKKGEIVREFADGGVTKDQLLAAA
ncbi:MAG TPA: sugar ABC transporter ATP-binding protein [Lichenihabitans sp.]|jgi:ribose transport system ATP-binding protein|nr:sugar ABC transporter ATP-binding protein [Lichenihabitans sp.]